MLSLSQFNPYLLLIMCIYRSSNIMETYVEALGIIPKKLLGKLPISYHWEYLVLIFEVDSSVSLQKYHWF